MKRNKWMNIHVNKNKTNKQKPVKQRKKLLLKSKYPPSIQQYLNIQFGIQLTGESDARTTKYK